MEKEWYVVNTYSGHENKVKEKLERNFDCTIDIVWNEQMYSKLQ